MRNVGVVPVRRMLRFVRRRAWGVERAGEEVVLVRRVGGGKVRRSLRRANVGADVEGRAVVLLVRVLVLLLAVVVLAHW